MRLRVQIFAVALSAAIFCVFAPALARGRPPAPLALQVTPFAHTPQAFDSPPRVWLSMAGGQLQEWSRLRAQYTQAAYFNMRVGGQYTHGVPCSFLNRLGYGLDLTVLSALGTQVEVAPAIDETHDVVGVGNLRMFVFAQGVDSAKRGWDLAGFRLVVGALFRATAPTASYMGRKHRYPLLPWKDVLGPDSGDRNSAILEMFGLGALVSRWQDRLAAQIHWTPVVWGAVRGDTDRFLTHFHVVLSGRPIQYLELVAEAFGLLAYNDPRYTADVIGGGTGFGVRGLIQDWSVTVGFRYGGGDILQTYGKWVVGAQVAYRLPLGEAQNATAPVSPTAPSSRKATRN
jgi:hypothetical protein